MIRYISSAYVFYLRVLLMSLIVTGCGSPPVSLTPTAIVTEKIPLTSTPPSEATTSKIEQFLILHTQQETFTGAVLVAQDGEILLSQGFGWADRDNEIANTPQTRYRLGSVTKQFTAAAILVLQTQGKLDVQDRVCFHIPECPEAWQGITLHHLLTHTSGIPNITEFPDYKTFKTVPTTPPQTITRFKDKPLEFPPGEKWHYSNSGYLLLGYIIERVSGQSYEMFLRQNIFEPLQMKNTGYDHSDGSLATGYTGVDSHWEKPDAIDMTLPYAAGGLYSTVEDLYRWDQALYADQLISQESLDRMFAPHANTRFPGMSYGYGWFIGKMDNHLVVSHGGGIDGFVTEIRRYIADETTIIILSNRQTSKISKIADQIGWILFEE